MTTALGIAGVTAVLRNLLNDGLINNNVAGALGTTVTVGIGPPDRVVPPDGSESSQLNLFLYRVTPNTGWCNEGLPWRDPSGRHRLSNPPLALNLHYLVSAYSGGDLHGEILLGYAMQLLHETPVLTRQAVQTALQAEPSVGVVLPPALRAVATSGLQHQPELIKMAPEYLNTEELSKVWTATQSHLRPTAAYVASVVLIQALEPLRSPLPVLTRGPVDLVSGRERGPVVEPSLVPPLPTLDAVAPAGGQPAARLGQTVDLTGFHLDGTGRSVVLTNDRFQVDETLPALAGGGAGVLQFVIPTAPAADFPVGAYEVRARLVPPGEVAPRDSNRLAMTLAPDIPGLPVTVPRVGGTASFTLSVLPAVRAGQTVALVLGEQEHVPQPFTPPATTLDFEILDAPAGSHLARLRVDGIDSPIIDPSTDPPSFLDQRVVIT